MKAFLENKNLKIFFKLNTIYYYFFSFFIFVFLFFAGRKIGIGKNQTKQRLYFLVVIIREYDMYIEFKFCRLKFLGKLVVQRGMRAREYDMYIEFKFCKLKFLGKLVDQRGMRAWFSEKSCIRAVSSEFTFSHMNLNYQNHVNLNLYRKMSSSTTKFILFFRKIGSLILKFILFYFYVILLIMGFNLFKIKFMFAKLKLFSNLCTTLILLFSWFLIDYFHVEITCCKFFEKISIKKMVNFEDIELIFIIKFKMISYKF